jgi:chemotaxis protein MotA
MAAESPTLLWVGKNKNILGLIFCLLLFSSGFLIHGNMGLFFNLSGLAIVFGGTLGATIVSFRLKQLGIVFRVLVGSYKSPVKSVDEIVEILVDLSVKSRLRGLHSLEDEDEEGMILFLRNALGLLVDNHPLPQIRDMLNTEMYFFRMRREEIERVLRTMAEISPAFGLVGSVVGLMAMLAGVGDTSTILATVPIALTSTLYGIILANFFFLPFATNIRDRTDQELLLQKIITEGVLAIGSDYHPRVLEMRLKSFLTPSQRQGKLVSLERIREKFGIPAENEQGS